MTHTYTINNTTANSGTITLSNTSGTGYTIGTTTTTGPIYTTGTSSTWGTASEALRINQTNPASIEVKGKMILNGQDLEERLETIEKVLQIPERDVKLEKKHPKLKKLYDEYIHALAKYRTFEAIKGED